MANLNEDCLHYIFNYLTPVEWVQVSKVCQLWKITVGRQWKRVTEIIYLDDNLEEGKNRNKKKAPVITSQIADEIVVRAAPFIKVLRGSTLCRKNWRKCVLFGTFWYSVDGFSSDNTLKLLAENATVIREIVFNKLPEAELVTPFFIANKIEKIQFTKPVNNFFYENVPTEQVKEMNAIFKVVDAEKFVSFERRFSNLQKLNLQIQCGPKANPKLIMSKILPFILKTKSLNLEMVFDHNGNHFDDDFYRDIPKLSQLEELSLASSDHFCDGSFVEQLPMCCPHLRTVKLDGIVLAGEKLEALLSLSDLESLEVEGVYDLLPLKVSKKNVLSRLHIGFPVDDDDDIEWLESVVKEMPKLQELKIDGVFVEEFSEIALKLAVAATSKGKVVLLMESFTTDAEEDFCHKLKITKTDLRDPEEFDDDSKTLRLILPLHGKKFVSARALLQKRLKQLGSFVLRDLY